MFYKYVELKSEGYLVLHTYNTNKIDELLNKEDITGPYVLVGHSIGGAHIRYYTHLFPEQIDGLFLIDPSHENMKDSLPSETLMQRFDWFAKRKLAWSGIPYYLLPNPPHPTYKTSKSIRAYAEEYYAIDASIAIFKNAAVDHSDIPIHIISATSQDADLAQSDLHFMQLLMEHTKSPIKSHVVFNKPHHIHVTDPQIVIEEFRTFYNRIVNSEKEATVTLDSISN